MHFQSTTLEKNDAVLLGLAVVNVRITTKIPEVVGEELSHAFFVALLFVLHISHEALWLSISVGSF